MQGSQLGSCIEKARPYYEARRLAKEVGRLPALWAGCMQSLPWALGPLHEWETTLFSFPITPLSLEHSLQLWPSHKHKAGCWWCAPASAQLDT